MAENENAKQRGFVEDVRSWSARFRQIVEEGRELSGRYSSLYDPALPDSPPGILTEADCAVEIVPSGIPGAETRLESVTGAVSVIDTIYSSYDTTGQDTVLERVSV